MRECLSKSEHNGKVQSYNWNPEAETTLQNNPQDALGYFDSW